MRTPPSIRIYRFVFGPLGFSRAGPDPLSFSSSLPPSPPAVRRECGSRPPVRPSVRPPARPPARPSVRPSVRPPSLRPCPMTRLPCTHACPAWIAGLEGMARPGQAGKDAAAASRPPMIARALSGLGNGSALLRQGPAGRQLRRPGLEDAGWRQLIGQGLRPFPAAGRAQRRSLRRMRRRACLRGRSLRQGGAGRAQGPRDRQGHDPGPRRATGAHGGRAPHRGRGRLRCDACGRARAGRARGRGRREERRRRRRGRGPGGRRPVSPGRRPGRGRSAGSARGAKGPRLRRGRAAGGAVRTRRRRPVGGRGASSARPPRPASGAAPR